MLSLPSTPLNYYSYVDRHQLIAHREYGGCLEQSDPWPFTRLFLSVRVESGHTRLMGHNIDDAIESAGLPLTMGKMGGVVDT